MSATKKKTAVGPNKTIKWVVLFVLALILGFFFVGRAEASGSFFTDDFEVYDIGDLGGQGYWENVPYKYSMIVTATTSESGTKSISTGPSSYGYGNRKNGIGIATTTSGILTFQWRCDDTDWCSIFLGLQKYDGVNDYENEYPKISKTVYDNKLYLEGYNATSTIVANSVPEGAWNKITLEYSYATHKARAKLNDGTYSAYVDLGTLDYANSLRIEVSGHAVYLTNIDHILSQKEFEFWCGYEKQCEFCNTSTTCAFYNCYWSEEQNYCYSSPAPELPVLEDCSGYGITERILCEIKNFFYRLFIPSPQKIIELKETLDLIKEKFPYNYILALKNFFVYMKDNINESQAVNFSILGKAGIVNFDFFNSTTTLAGVSQSFLTIFKTFFKFLVILVFGLWCFSFIKRIFK